MSQRRSLNGRVQEFISQREVQLQLEGHETRARNGTGEIDTNPTLREIEVLLAKVDYGSNRAAGKSLGISEQTVKNHISSIMMRLQANHITHAIWLMWPVLKDYWPNNYRPRGVPSQARHWKPGDYDRRSGYQRRQRNPSVAGAIYSLLGLVGDQD